MSIWQCQTTGNVIIREYRDENVDLVYRHPNFQACYKAAFSTINFNSLNTRKGTMQKLLVKEAMLFLPNHP